MAPDPPARSSIPSPAGTTAPARAGGEIEALASDRARRGRRPGRWNTRTIVEMSLAVAMAAALGQLKLFTMPQGGSVSLEMLPILFVAVRRGVVPGVATGFVYGFVQLALPGAFLVNPVQVALDYPLAFAAVGLAGLVPVTSAAGPPTAEAVRWSRRNLVFAGTLAAAALVAVAARFLCHYVSGIVFFSEYAPAGQAVWVYSLTYNLLYLLPEAGITLGLLAGLLPSVDLAESAAGKRKR